MRRNSRTSLIDLIISPGSRNEHNANLVLDKVVLSDMRQLGGSLHGSQLDHSGEHARFD